MDLAEQDALRAIESEARFRCRDHDPAHDVAHLQRVVANARLIVDRERDAADHLDEFVIYAACWLHDVVQLPKGSGPPGESARRSADFAKGFLRELGIDAARAEHAAAAVRTHSYSGGERPASAEAGIVQDADRLDALGAVGIARLFSVAGTLDSAFYHPDDPLAESRPLQDARYALDHIPAKLLKLPALMTTDAGRAIGQERAEFVRAYRDQFLREAGMEVIPRSPVRSERSS
jgi:uncharacterized protein